MPDLPQYAVHHVTLSVRYLDETQGFYAQFGYQLALRWEAADGSLSIAHLVKDGAPILELFCYSASGGMPCLEQEPGNNLNAVGVKHISFRVSNIRQAYEAMAASGHHTTEIQHGRTGIDYFFVRDPDGLWVEIAEDSRSLDSRFPVTLIEPS